MRHLLTLGTLIIVGLLAGPLSSMAQVGPNLFVACHDDSSIARINVSTEAVTNPFIPSDLGRFWPATGVDFGSDWEIYVTGGFSSAIFRYDGLTGAFLDVFAVVDSAAGQIKAVGHDVEVPVGAEPDLPSGQDHRDGTVFATGTNPHGLTFGPDGSLYAAWSVVRRVGRHDGTTGQLLDELV